MSKLWWSQDQNLKMFQHPPPPPPADPAVLQAALQPGQQLVHLNWSYFKPEFLGNSDEDAEAHLLCTNDWMNAHHLLKVSKSKDFV